jgi:hypothetical protein
MKWYSVKKYKPTQDAYRVFVLKENGHSDVCFIEDDGKFFLDSNSELDITDKVTHFAIPDPVEI